MTDGLRSTLLSWIPRQRWFAGKSGVPALDPLVQRSTPLEDGVTLVEWLIEDAADPSKPLYYVPVTVRSHEPRGFEHGVIANNDELWWIDAPHDPAYAARLIREATQSGDGTAESTAVSPVASTVLSGEQSNTSILYWVDGDPASAPPELILKVFRRLHDGENPDVVLQSALSAAGVERVPRAVGHLTFEWVDHVGLRRRGHLAFAQEFVAGVEDAWRVTLRGMAAGTNTDEPLRALGAATAEVHDALRRLFPTDPPTPDRTAALIRSMRERADAAARAVPELAHLLPSVHRVYSELASAPWPDLQRVHGDYHLGQVLHAPERGWLLVDFEGEPLRPLAERSENDVSLRDVAGMLRSLDYAAAASANAGHPVGSDWTARARSAFLDGYDAGAVSLARYSTLLDALELDKALYEALYEAGNRPEWLPIPVAAVGRLVQAHA